MAHLNDQLCSKKVIDHVSEWRVGVTWPAHALPAGKLLIFLTIVPQGSEYRIVQVYGGDSVNQLLLDEYTKMFGDEQVGLPPVEHWRMLYGRDVDSVLVVDDAVVRRHYSEHRTTRDMKDVPVWIVTFHGVHMLHSGPCMIDASGKQIPSTRDPYVFGDTNVVLDAETGEVLEGFSYNTPSVVQN